MEIEMFILNMTYIKKIQHYLFVPNLKKKSAIYDKIVFEVDPKVTP